MDGASEDCVAGPCDLEHLCTSVSTSLPFSISWTFLFLTVVLSSPSLKLAVFLSCGWDIQQSLSAP